MMGTNGIPGLSALGAPPDPATHCHAFGVANQVLKRVFGGKTNGGLSLSVGYVGGEIRDERCSIEDTPKA